MKETELHRENFTALFAECFPERFFKPQFDRAARESLIVGKAPM
jgi:hypothetical protein